MVRHLGITIPESGATVIFGMPMPESWSKKKKAEFLGKAHQQRPDWDNLGKALSDAVLEEDCGIWDLRCVKIWSSVGYIEILEDDNE